jgi:hypothetical protein
LGATVKLICKNQTFVRPVLRSYSYLASNDPRVHFGLGDVDTVDAIEVQWADGTSESFAAGAVNREITVEQGQGQPLP